MTIRADTHADEGPVPLETCVCGHCFFCPDGWHADDEAPCSCTADCALADDDVLAVEVP